MLECKNSIKKIDNNIKLNKNRNHNLEVREVGISPEEFRKFYVDEDNENYIIEYLGNVIEGFSKIDYASVWVTSPIFAVASVKKGMVDQLLKDVEEIIYLEKSFPFTFPKLEKIDSKEYYNFLNGEKLEYTGEGVIVGIIGSGIDYLNPRFTFENNESRILAIWDQTLDGGKIPEFSFYGTLFLKDDINKAINANIFGENPYNIVPHIDETGYGTELAGIVGGRKLFTEDPFISVAPSCEYAIVKLKEAKKTTLMLNGVEEVDVPVYEGTDIRFALRYFADLQATIKRPVVVYLPLGTNLGGHDGFSPLERDIDYYVASRGFTIVTNTGDEGLSSTHTSGALTVTEDKKEIEINVGEGQKNLYVSIWLLRPDKISIGIIPPVGEPIERIPAVFTDGEEIFYNISGSKATIKYFISTSTGDQFVMVFIENVISGLWKIILNGDYIVNGRYDAWLFQRVLLKPGTRFLNPDPFITLTIPSTAFNIISTACFDSKDNSPNPISGWGFTRDNRVQPSVCSASNNILTTGLNGKDVIVNGVSAGGAIISGAAALLMEWGIIKKNDLNMYTPKVKTYLIRGTNRLENIHYPNELCGFGRFSFEEMFKSLESRKVDEDKSNNLKVVDYLNRDTYINIPVEIYKRLKE